MDLHCCYAQKITILYLLKNSNIKSKLYVFCKRYYYDLKQNLI